MLDYKYLVIKNLHLIDIVFYLGKGNGWKINFDSYILYSLPGGFNDLRKSGSS